jgi:hypothetical protein
LRDNKYHYIGREQQSSIAQGPFIRGNGGKRKRTKKKTGGDEANKVIFTFDDLKSDILYSTEPKYMGKYFKLIPAVPNAPAYTAKFIGMEFGTPEKLIFQLVDENSSEVSFRVLVPPNRYSFEETSQPRPRTTVAGGKRKRTRTKKQRGGDEEVILKFDDLFNDIDNPCSIREDNCKYINKYFNIIDTGSPAIGDRDIYKYFGKSHMNSEDTLVLGLCQLSRDGEISCTNIIHYPRTRYDTENYRFKLIPDISSYSPRPRTVAGGPPYSEADLKVISDFISEVSLRKNIEKIKKRLKITTRQ